MTFENDFKELVGETWTLKDIDRKVQEDNGICHVGEPVQHVLWCNGNCHSLTTEEHVNCWEFIPKELVETSCLGRARVRAAIENTRRSCLTVLPYVGDERHEWADRRTHEVCDELLRVLGLTEDFE